MVAASTVLTVLLSKLGGNGSVGFIPAIEGGAALLPQVVGAILFHGKRPVKRILLLWHIVGTVPFLLLMAATIYWSSLLSPLLVRTMLLVGFGCTTAILGMVIPSWTDWLAHLFKTQHRGTVIGLLLAGSALVSMLGSLTAGYLIKLDSSPPAYARHYLLAATFALLSMAVFACVRDHREDDAPGESAINKGRGHYRSLLDSCDASVRDSNTQAFMVGRALTVCGFSVIPFVTLYYTSPAGGGLSASFVVSCGAAQALAGALSHVLLGRIGDRFGHRLGLIFGASMQILTLVVVLSSSGAVSCALAFFATGIALGSTALAHLNLLLETCPHENRVAHITVNNVVLGVSSVVAPLLSAWAAHEWGIQSLFLICLALSVIAAMWLIFRMQEPRQASTLPDGQTSMT
jgi:MFS family permease